MGSKHQVLKRIDGTYLMHKTSDAGNGTVLITGGAGRVGGPVADGLAGSWSVRLTDRRADPDRPDLVVGDLSDRGLLAEVVEQVDAVVHLGGVPDPRAEWPELLQDNITATAQLMDACLLAGVRRLVLASSVHVTGALNRVDDWPVSPDAEARPCCRYGVSKVAIEGMGAWYAAQMPDASVVRIRFGLVAERPRWRPEAAGWISTTDAVELVRCALAAPPGVHTCYGVSESDAPPRYRTDSMVALGFRSQEPPLTASTVVGSRPDYPVDCLLWGATGADPGPTGADPR